jgi:hypothetical protein
MTGSYGGVESALLRVLDDICGPTRFPVGLFSPFFSERYASHKGCDIRRFSDRSPCQECASGQTNFRQNIQPIPLLSQIVVCLVARLLKLNKCAQNEQERWIERKRNEALQRVEKTCLPWRYFLQSGIRADEILTC